MKERVKRRIATICLLLASFFNPFGMDVLTKKLLDSGLSYWNIISLYYLLAGFFFILFFVFANINPLKYIYQKIKNLFIYHKIKNLFTKKHN